MLFWSLFLLCRMLHKKLPSNSFFHGNFIINFPTYILDCETFCVGVLSAILDNWLWQTQNDQYNMHMLVYAQHELSV